MSESEKRVSIRIVKTLFDKIINGEKKEEYRKDTSFWSKRLEPYVGMENPRLQAVFICGKRVHRRKVVKVKYIRTPEWISKQYVPTPFCYEIHLGKKVS